MGSYTHASANSTQTLRRGTMVITKITRQGVFNENLRRSLDKLVADKSDLHKEIEKTQWVLEKTRPRRLGPGFKLKPLGGVRIVNSSSESELDSITPDINTSFKPFNRKFKSRCAVRRQSASSESGFSSSNSSYKFNKCDDEKEREINRKEFLQKDGVIFNLRNNVESLNRKLEQLNVENSDLKDKHFQYKLQCTELQRELQSAHEAEENLRGMISKLSNIVQSQDDEIARMSENIILSNQNCRCNDYREISVKLKEAEIMLSEQTEVNKQLKQYLKTMLLKICE